MPSKVSTKQYCPLHVLVALARRCLLANSLLALRVCVKCTLRIFNASLGRDSTICPNLFQNIGLLLCHCSLSVRFPKALAKNRCHLVAVAKVAYTGCTPHCLTQTMVKGHKLRTTHYL